MLFKVAVVAAGSKRELAKIMFRSSSYDAAVALAYQKAAELKYDRFIMHDMLAYVKCMKEWLPFVNLKANPQPSAPTPLPVIPTRGTPIPVTALPTTTTDIYDSLVAELTDIHKKATAAGIAFIGYLDTFASDDEDPTSVYATINMPAKPDTKNKLAHTANAFISSIAYLCEEWSGGDDALLS